MLLLEKMFPKPPGAGGSVRQGISDCLPRGLGRRDPEHPMQRTKVNFIVDAVAFVALVLLTATGVLIRYVLPAGSGRFSALWGMDRHGWGQLHYWFSVVLMAAFGFHLFLHWRWVVNVVKGRPRAGSGPRLALAGG